eukprot:CAMPEP_0116122022 /NCGR_PEP_ID=MMETSP0329-20121206/3998_1 /TAXON_ID=697910 /ORGANISM="Pseudo-nitzschia arenysensis, Strain B593" /LENGTH=758 /DNA_ID=CAMNT_0003615853 /DNA_START=21 /DNA_END=2297 /DNA_ORIENTATION=-
MTSRSSMRSRLMISWHALVLLALCSSGFARSVATTGLRSSAGIDNKAFPGRVLQKEEELLENVDVTESPTQPPTTSETEEPSIENFFEKQLVEFELLPFSILVHGSLTTDDLIAIREDLQGYLLNALLEEDVEEVVDVKTDSIEITMTHLEEIEIPLDEEVEEDGTNEGLNEGLNEGIEGDEEEDDKKEEETDGGKRSLSLVLTSSVMPPTVSTLLAYEASAVLSFKQEDDVKKDVIEDTTVVIQERQIEVLENTVDLQEYFTELFVSEQQQVDSDVEVILQDPVALMEVQVDDREVLSLSWEETLDSIQLTLDTLKKKDDVPKEIETESGNEEEDIEDKKIVINPNASDQPVNASKSSSMQSIFSWKVITGMACAAMVLIGLVVLMCVLRKKKKQQSKKAVDGAIEVDNVDKPDTKKTQRQKNSFFQKSSRKKMEGNAGDEQGNDEDKSELDSFGEKINMYNPNATDDEDSMMGYSLTSLNRSRLKYEAEQDHSLLGTDGENDNSLLGTDGGQDDSLIDDIENLSIISSISEACNSLVMAGVQKILKTNNTDQQTPKSALGENIGWDNEQEQEPSLLGDDEAIESTQEESLSRSDTFESEDVESANIHQNDGSRFEPVISSTGIAATASQYYGEDEIMMAQKRTTSVAAPMDEFHSATRISPIRNIESNYTSPVIQNTRAVVVDDASDVPSDERLSARVPVQRTPADPYRYPDAIRNSRVVDNDPAVLDYLVKGDTRNGNHGMSESMRRQPRMTMEL